MRGKDHGYPGLEDLGDGRFALNADLTFETVTALLDRSKRLFAAHEHIDVDMSGVRQADSAGLALLLEWRSWARTAGRRIAYQNIPPQIAAVARISEVEALLSGCSESGQPAAGGQETAP